MKSRLSAGKKIIFLLAILVAADFTSSRAQNPWTQKTDFGGTGRTEAVGFSIANKGYIGTGITYDGINYIRYNDFWQYDPVADAWTQKANFGGIGRLSAVGFSIGSKGYIGTGRDSTHSDLKDFWEYDPSINIWTQKADFAGGLRIAAFGFSIGNKGYIGGGGHISGLKTDFWEFDPSINTWTQKANYVGGNPSSGVGFSIGSRGYVGVPDGYQTNFAEYDPSTNAWTQKANYGGPGMFSIVGFSIDSSGYIGRWNINNPSQIDFWKYDPSTNTWSQKPTLETGRADGVGFSIGNKGYIGTGWLPNGSYFNDLWEYDPDYSISADTIITGVIVGSPFCPEAILNVPFSSVGTFNTGNIYTAQLSDKTGNFSTPTLIGTLNSTANSGAISATIPSNPKAGTKYRIRVTSDNPIVIGTNNGSNLQVIACRIVTALPASGISATAASLNWTGASCFVKYKVQYRKQGTSSWTTKYSTTNSYTIMGLVANTVYEYRIQTYCSEGGSSKSGFTAIQTFTTTLRLASGLASAEETMSMYPNPASDQTVIQFTLPQSSHVCIRVYEINGKESETLLNEDVEQGDHSLLLNTDHFSKGVYLVKMISDSGIENQKLIVQ